MILGKFWKRGALAQSCKRPKSTKGCLRVCPDLAKKLGFRALIPIRRSLKFIPGSPKLPGTSSLMWVWAKQFPGALEHLPKGVAGTSVNRKSWVGVEVEWWQEGEEAQC